MPVRFAEFQVSGFMFQIGSGGFSMCWSQPRAAGKGFRQTNELSDFPDFFRERFAREFLPHLQFHGSFNL